MKSVNHKMIQKRPDGFEIGSGSSLGSWGGKAFNGICESQQAVQTQSRKLLFLVDLSLLGFEKRNWIKIQKSN